MSISATSDAGFSEKGLTFTTFFLLLSLLVAVCVPHQSAQCINVKILTVDAELLVVNVEEADSHDKLVLPPYPALYPSERSVHTLINDAQHALTVASIRLIRGPAKHFGYSLSA